MGGVPIRINCQPEVTYFTLRGAAAEVEAMAELAGTVR